MKKNQGFPRGLVVSFILFFTIFKAYPSIDIYISSLFFDGEKFPLNMEFNPIIMVLDRFIEFGCIALWVTFVFKIAKKEYKSYGLKYTALMRKLYYISAVGLIGSVAIVNFIKHYIMRCRPKYIEEFGGDAAFTEAWSKNLYEYENMSCLSFVSGHSAIGFLIYAIAFTFPIGSRNRRKFILLGTLVGGSFGFIRIIQGQHFISDVIFSGYVVYFSSLILSIILKPSLSVSVRQQEI
jgi:lipid A 4'-phosphatase